MRKTSAYAEAYAVVQAVAHTRDERERERERERRERERDTHTHTHTHTHTQYVGGAVEQGLPSAGGGQKERER
jgi:hypothetical protein